MASGLSTPRGGTNLNDRRHRYFWYLLSALALLAATVLASPSRQAQGADGQTTPNEIVVVFASSVPAAQRAAVRDATDTQAVSGLGRQGFQLVAPEPGQTVAGAVAELRARPAVLAADPNVTFHASSIPNDPRFGEEWGLLNTGQNANGFSGGIPGADIDATLAWDRTVGDPSVVVADIDTGYLFAHPDLGPVAWRNPGEVPDDGIDNDANGHVDDWRGWDTADNDNDPTDTEFLEVAPGILSYATSEPHGVHTAGTIGAQGNNLTGVTGVAQNIRIMPVRAGSGYGGFTLSSLIDAMNYAGANGARVANMSLNKAGILPTILAAQAANQRTLFVVSAGNSGTDNETAPQSPCDDPTVAVAGYVPPPGVIDNVVCVAATDQADQLASFSNFGATSVDLGAPGTETLSTMRQRQMVPVATTGFAGWTTPSPPADDSAKGFVVNPGGSAIGSGAPANFGSQQPGTTHATQSPAISVPAGVGCTLRFQTGSVQTGDDRFSWTLFLDGSQQATRVEPAAPTTGNIQWRSATFEVPATGSSHSVQVQFAFHRGTAGDPQARAFVMDTAALECLTPTYGYLEGTSMAAPHVSGTAGLMFSLKPSATVTQVRSALLAGVDPLPSLTGKTATGGRLNAWKALNALLPMDTRITSGPAAGIVTGPDATFTFDTNDTGSAGFQCRLDAGSFAPCTSPQTYASLSAGNHEFAVRSAVTGGVDATPAAAAWTVAATKPTVKCKVPKLIGKKLKAAKRLLRKAHCKLGRVKKKHGATAKRGKIKSQSPKAGKVRPAGTKVKVTLKP